MIVNFHEPDVSASLKYSVIVARDENGFVFVQHKDRDTWEIPGGHIEAGETSLEAANRELREETGATDFTLREICNYSVTRDDVTTYGGLFFAEIRRYKGTLEFEIEKVESFTKIPENLTYPDILPIIFQEVLDRLRSP